jgi:hypothetical protein
MEEKPLDTKDGQEKIIINRAPVLTLWAAVVAERLGYDHDEALTLAKAVAGLNAQSKGRRLGIFHDQAEEEKPERQRSHKRDETFPVEVLGRPVPAVNTGEGIRAVDKDKPISPRSVQRYLETRFGEALPDARKAMEKLAGSLSQEALRRRAYPLYEQFRPKIPDGARGWGAKGELDLDKL